MRLPFKAKSAFLFILAVFTAFCTFLILKKKLNRGRKSRSKILINYSAPDRQYNIKTTKEHEISSEQNEIPVLYQIEGADEDETFANLIVKPDFYFYDLDIYFNKEDIKNSGDNDVNLMLEYAKCIRERKKLTSEMDSRCLEGNGRKWIKFVVKMYSNNEETVSKEFAEYLVGLLSSIE